MLGRAGRAGSSGDDTAKMRTSLVRLHFARRASSQQGGLVGNSGELKREDVRALMEKGMLKTVREKFVLCAESGLGKLHIMKNGTMCWRGRQWCEGVLEESDRCRKCRSSGVGGEEARERAPLCLNVDSELAGVTPAVSAQSQQKLRGQQPLTGMSRHNHLWRNHGSPAEACHDKGLLEIHRCANFAAFFFSATLIATGRAVDAWCQAVAVAIQGVSF